MLQRSNEQTGMTTSAPVNLIPGQHRKIGDIIGDAFADDPVNRWVFGGEDGMKAFYTLAARKLYLRKGYGHLLGEHAGSLWLPPGVDKHLPLWRSLDIALTMLRYSGPGGLRRGMAIEACLASHKPARPHYYLYAIGARRQHRGKGLGGRLMGAGLQRADQSGMPAYLESSKESNLGFYRRFGFEVVTQVTPAPGSPPMWLMWREPQPPASSAT
jgi:GNAT superfamily N-acetyltransferase